MHLQSRWAANRASEWSRKAIQVLWLGVVGVAREPAGELGFFCTTISRVCREWSEKKRNHPACSSSLSLFSCHMSQENVQTTSSLNWQGKSKITNSEHNTSNREAESLQKSMPVKLRLRFAQAKQWKMKDGKMLLGLIYIIHVYCNTFIYLYCNKIREHTHLPACSTVVAH